MIVPAIFSDASRRFVNSEELDELVQKKVVVAFRRSNGWVTVGYDEMRGDPESRRESSWKDRKSLSKQGYLDRFFSVVFKGFP